MKNILIKNRKSHYIMNINKNRFQLHSCYSRVIVFVFIVFSVFFLSDYVWAQKETNKNDRINKYKKEYEKSKKELEESKKRLGKLSLL